MRRAIPLAVVLLASAGAAPAWAHQEISPASVPVGRPAFLALSAANEKRVDLTSVTMTPPSGQQFGHATRDPAGWTSSLSHTRISWTGGAIRPDRFEQFGFDVEPIGQPGPLTFRVVLGYADGTTTEADVPVTAVAAGDQPAPATTEATGPPTTGPPTTGAAGQPAEPEGTAAPVPVAGDGGGGGGLAVAALVVAVAALVTAVASLVRGGRSRPATPAPSGKGQDW